MLVVMSVGATEEEVYAAVGLPWITPELRTNRGELDAAEKGELPSLIELDDLRGDLQIAGQKGCVDLAIERSAEAGAPASVRLSGSSAAFVDCTVEHGSADGLLSNAPATPPASLRGCKGERAARIAGGRHVRVSRTRPRGPSGSHQNEPAQAWQPGSALRRGAPSWCLPGFAPAPPPASARAFSPAASPRRSRSLPREP